MPHLAGGHQILTVSVRLRGGQGKGGDWIPPVHALCVYVAKVRRGKVVFYSRRVTDSCETRELPPCTCIRIVWKPRIELSTKHAIDVHGHLEVERV